MDISLDVLTVTEHSVKPHGLTHYVTSIRSDLLRDLPELQYDLIATNPPYVDEENMTDLPKEYKHESALGLTSGSDGLKLMRRILGNAPDYFSDDEILVYKTDDSMVYPTGQYPNVPFTWLEFDDGSGDVFMLTRQQLIDARAHFGIYKD